MPVHILSNQTILERARSVAERIMEDRPHATRIFGVPRGGIPAAYAVLAHHPHVAMTDSDIQADVIIDDIIDSGATRAHWNEKHPNKPFYALVDKTALNEPLREGWVVFPWEADAETGIEDNIRRLLQWVGDDPKRGGLHETPHRVAKAWRFWCSGYGKEPADVLKVFEDGAENCDEMVVVKDIPLYSHCEHHLAPIFGSVTIAYVPNGRIVGLSKLSRLADVFARRLQVQERLTNQIADALHENLNPKGVGVIVKARHLCMESRGVCQQGHYTVTSALRGVLRTSAEARAEFMTLAK